MELSRQFCRTCEALDSLPFDEHIMTKQHQICAHKVELSLYRTTHGIYVNNLPSSVPKEQIVSFFAKYGTILSSMICDNNVYGIFEFEEKKVVADLITAKRVDFDGRSINIRARNLKQEKKYVNEESPKVKPDEAIELLRAQSDIVTEIVSLHRYIQPVSRDVFYAALCMDLKCVLQQYMHCIVYPFGSTVTGLDFPTSDVDAYVYVNPANRVCAKATGDRLARRLVEIIPQYLISSQLFAKVVSIPNANTPIIKCVHSRTGISCDINFKNMLGVCNSYLIKKYLSYNKRLNIALLILKYWASVHNLSGVGKFSNYSVTVLFLYCFMQEPYNLPSIHQLQTNTHIPNVQDGWDADFAFVQGYVLTDALNSLGVVDLLVAFFKFYANFNYEDLVICPYIGRALERSAFLEGGVLPPEYNKYMQRFATDALYPTTPICVQDFFELCRNITRAVKTQEFDEFIDLCKQGFATLNPQGKNNPLRLYPILFDSYCSDGVTFHFVLIETQKLKAYLNKTNNCQNVADKKIFQTFVKDFMTRILTEVYLFEIIAEAPTVHISSSPPIKLQKKNNHADSTVNDNGDFKVIYDCQSHVNVWTSRSIIMKDQTRIKDENVFDTEVKLSNYIANTVCRKIKTQFPLFKVRLVLRQGTESDRDVEVVLTNNGANLYAFKDFCIIFVKFVKNFFIRYITFLNDKSSTTTAVVNDDDTQNNV